MRREVDLNSHINASVTKGHPADFEVVLEPVAAGSVSGWERIPNRQAVVRQDTGKTIAVVSNRYTLVPHTRILDVIERAIEPLDVGPVPRGIYVDRNGARMRALYKFPTLAQGVRGNDDICPCVQVRNAYDGSERISVHIGAFRFVCTNLAVGGGGAFAGGFVSIHAGDIPIEEVAGRLEDYLTRFERIVEMYRQWSGTACATNTVEMVFRKSLKGKPEGLWEALQARPSSSVFDAYNAMTDYATHRMRTARRAFELLERINTAFQTAWPVAPIPQPSEQHAIALTA